jgi:predicted amidohydrolase YtcJ
MLNDKQVYFGADIYNVDEARPRVEAVAVGAGKIIAVGSKADCLSLVSKAYEPVDLRGYTLLPGFIAGSEGIGPKGCRRFDRFSMPVKS